MKKRQPPQNTSSRKQLPNNNLFFTVEDIARFLLESYGNSSSSIVIYEDDAPNYLIGTSTGIDAAIFMLTEDLTQSCPMDRGEDAPCTPVRVSVLDIDDGGDDMNQEKGDTLTTSPSDSMNLVLARAAQRHMEAGYPQNLLSLKGSDDTIKSQVYVSQSTLYTQPGAELTWRIIIVAPGASSDTDAITLDTNSSLVVGIAVVGALGILICSVFLYIFYTKRLEKAVVYADWRFTCAFICGCILLNASTFTLLGENTDGMCLLRLWTFHICIVMTLSPLFVKVWRIYKLVGSQNLRRHTIPNSQAGLYTMPMIVTQVAILVVFTLVDPPRQMEIIEEDGGLVLQRIVCGSDSDALFYTLGAYEGIFVFVGCFLAYLTRKLQDDFGESKQLIFSMYNIAFVGIMVVIIVQVAGLDGNGQSMMQAVGVFWGTITSTGAFVIPRLIQIREGQRESRNIPGRGNGNVRISGLDFPISDFRTSHNFSAAVGRPSVSADYTLPATSGASELFTKEVQVSGDQTSTPSLSNVMRNDDDGDDDKGSHTSETQLVLSNLDDEHTCAPSPYSVTHDDEEEKGGGQTLEPKQTQFLTPHHHLVDERAACVPSHNTAVTQKEAEEDVPIPNQSVSSLVGEQAPPSLGGQEKEAFSLSFSKRVDWTGIVS
jgi:7 transmembrane sweet-taste receptor of 3 GCPR